MPTLHLRLIWRLRGRGPELTVLLIHLDHSMICNNLHQLTKAPVRVVAIIVIFFPFGKQVQLFN